jgi:hypothetical protein
LLTLVRLPGESVFLVTLPGLRSFDRNSVKRGLQDRLLPAGERFVRDVPEKGGEQGTLNHSPKGAVVCPILV